MTFTYVDPTNTTRDRVRFLLGDTDAATAKLQDAEIAWLLSEWVDVRLAAAEGASTIATKFMALARSSRTVGDLTIAEDYSHTAAQWEAKSAELRASARRKSPPLAAAAEGALTSTILRDHSSDPTTDFTMGSTDNRRG